MSKSESTLINSCISGYSGQFQLDLQNIIVAVSGGPDSMALLYALYKFGAGGTVVHVNYEKRGKESDLDQELVEGMSAEWGFDCISLKPGIETGKGNFQNRAREIRYQIFRDLKRELDASMIVLAHHEDDQVETILQKIFRGSGPETWQGMKIWDGELFRPLLTVKKEQILDYCKTEAIPYRIDESNLRSEFARNMIRKELSPLLEGFFPGWVENILHLSKTGIVTEQAVSYVLTALSDEKGLILKGLLSLEEELHKAVLKRFVESKTETGVSKGFLDLSKSLHELHSGQRLQIDAQYWLLLDREHLKVVKEQDEAYGDHIILSRKELTEPTHKNNLELRISSSRSKDAVLYMDADQIQWPVTIRKWTAGDSFIPFGMKNHQKVSDHLTNRKISAEMKEKALILKGADGNIDALIFPEKTDNGEHGSISELVKITDSTRHIFQLKIKPEL